MKRKPKKRSQKSKKKSKKPTKKTVNKTNRLLVLTTLISIVVCIGIKEYMSIDHFDMKAHLQHYSLTQMNIHHKRLDYERDWNEHPEKQPVLKNMAKQYLYETLTDSLFNYWYGTTWDFNGTTQEPKKGKIACGYFITTTLVHCGFDLPRVKMAQQAASIIIKSLCLPNSIKSFNNKKNFKNYMDSQEQGLYILGLDTHVGYIWKSEEGLFFVHASYSGKKQVSKEKWDESVVLGKSKLLMVGNLLGNEELIQQWIEGRRIKLLS